MKRVLNSNTYPVDININGINIKILARESIVVNESDSVICPVGVMVFNQNEMYATESRNVLMG